MPVEIGSILNKRPDVRHRVIGGEGVVFLQDSAEVVVVNEIGARILQLIDGERSVAQMLDTLIVEYDIGRAQLEADVLAFAQQLVDAGIATA